MRLLYTLVFLLMTSVIYGQKSTLFQNVNVRAKELKHKLNDSGDSLIFKCERTIYEVVIFNDDFERVIKVRESEAIIPIGDIPVGRYIVEALLSDKLIVITLLRNEPIESLNDTPLVADSSDLFGRKLVSPKAAVASAEAPKATPKETVTKKIAETKTEVIKKPIQPKEELYGSESSIKKTDLAVAGKKAQPQKAKQPEKKVAVAKKKAPKKSSLSLFSAKTEVTKKAPEISTREIDAARANRVVSTYWVVYKINNGQSSEKIQKMSDQDVVDRMIKKIEIDMKTKTGRLNELTVWTVYDPSEFVQHKKKNKEDYMNIASESFNMEPYYKRVVDEDKSSDL